VEIEVVRRIKEEMNVLHKIKRRKANGIGHILCRKCLKKYIINGKREGKMEREDEVDDVNSHCMTVRK
jgi:hypothetical protein